MKYPKRHRKSFISGVLVVLGCLSIGTVQRHIDGFHKADTTNDILYFPNDKMLKHFTGGLSNILADYMWYKTVQYTSKEFNSEHARFTWLEQMVRTTIQFDPYYLDPYVYGSIFLAGINADDAAIEILHTGLLKRPNSWRIPYELHSIYLMNKRHEPGAQRLASHYAYMVGEREEGDMKEAYIELSRNLLLKKNMVDEAVEFFTQAVAVADDPLIRKQAQAQLRIALMEKNVVILNKAIESYEKDTGRSIVSLEELVQAGYINTVPNNPEDGDYLLTPERKVVNTILQQPILEYVLKVLQEKVNTFHAKHGRYPQSLGEAWPHYAEHEIKHPIPGNEWHYNPQTGLIQ